MVGHKYPNLIIDQMSVFGSQSDPGKLFLDNIEHFLTLKFSYYPQINLIMVVESIFALVTYSIQNDPNMLDNNSKTNKKRSFYCFQRNFLKKLLLIRRDCAITTSNQKSFVVTRLVIGEQISVREFVSIADISEVYCLNLLLTLDRKEDIRKKMIITTIWNCFKICDFNTMRALFRTLNHAHQHQREATEQARMSECCLDAMRTSFYSVGCVTYTSWVDFSHPPPASDSYNSAVNMQQSTDSQPLQAFIFESRILALKDGLTFSTVQYEHCRKCRARTFVEAKIWMCLCLWMFMYWY